MTDTAASVSSLTSALLENLIGEAPRLALAADALLGPVADSREELRKRLLADGHILPVADTTAATLSLCAVDGGSVREHLYAADLLVAVATSAEGITSTTSRPCTQRHWAVIRQYVSDNDRLLSAAMAGLELAVITNVTHDVRILDGAFRTPLLALIAAVTGTSPTTRAAACELITEDILAAARTVADPARWGTGTIVALPKADSSHEYSDLYHERHGLHLPGGDRFLAAQLLEPGEMLLPRAATEYRSLHAAIDEDGTPAARLTQQLEAAVTPLRQAAQEGRLFVSYVKPVSADTVVKLEYHSPTSNRDTGTLDPDTAAVNEGRRLARILSDETPGPYMQEPFAQHVVDLAAKNVATGAQALNHSMLSHLPNGGERYLNLLARSYRTATAKPAR